MKKHFLHRMFEPRAVAIVGASDRLDSVGGRVLHNIVSGGFAGAIYPVNPNREAVQGLPVYEKVSAIERAVDLVVLAIPAAAVPAALRDCAESGVPAVILMSAGFGETGATGASKLAELVDVARTWNIALLGPNSLGVLRPSHRLNASFARNSIKPGRVALLAQSVGFCNALLDWADSNGFGFSLVASPGGAARVDFGELLDFLSVDPETQSVLVYVERINDARAFLSGLRMVARVKPVIVLKSGRHDEPQAGSDESDRADRVFDAAIQRAGAVRVNTVHQLFTAARTLLAGAQITGQRLAIVTNAAGPGRMAADRAQRRAVRLADLSDAGFSGLRALMPAHWQPENPLDLLGDATAERYGAALAALMEARGVDGVLVLLTPQGMTDATACASAVIEAVAGRNKPVIACWMGQNLVDEGREQLAAAGIPHFTSPERGLDAFAYIAAYRRNQEVLLQVPPPLSAHEPPDVEGARLIIENALGERREALATTEAKAVLRAFRIAISQSINTTSPADALVAAETLGLPVAMKINSPDIRDKTAAGGVRLRVRDAHEVRHAYRDILARVEQSHPQARIRGVSVEPLLEEDDARELCIGIHCDPAFGPAISFGAGGTRLALRTPPQVALPPLNVFLCRDLIRRTLAAFNAIALTDAEQASLIDVLMRVSEIACELPELKSLEMNPVRIRNGEAIALDARMLVAPRRASTRRYGHMAVHPYPAQMALHWQLADGSDVEVRPIRPEDAEMERAFIEGLSAESRYNRFMYRVDKLSPMMLARFTQIDYDREMALAVVVDPGTPDARIIAVARYVANPDGQSCEFALTVADHAQHQGMGRRLMQALMNAARDRGLDIMEGEVLAQNRRMLRLCDSLGFRLVYSRDEPDVVSVRRHL